MKKVLIMLLGFSLVMFSCEKVEQDDNDAAPNEMATAEVQKQYFEESADIDLGKKLFSSYLNGNWEAIPQLYADTARIWRNTNWTNTEGLTPTEYVADLQQGLEGVDSYTFEPQIWDNVINSNGDSWVHFWGVWIGHNTVTDKQYEIPVHVAMMIKNGKIVGQGDIFNSAEIALDMQALTQ